MGRSITIEVTDEEYQALSEAGQATGETPGDLLRRLAQRERDLIAARRASEAAMEVAVQATTAARAQRTGRTVEEARAEWATAFPPLPSLPLLADPDPYCGALDVDDLAGGSNDRIDRDLADEYAGHARRG